MAAKTRIFITGASSGLMRRFISLIDADRYEIVGLTRDRTDKPDRGMTWVKGDVRDTAGLACHVQGCGIVVHAAAVTRTLHRRDYDEVNFRATERLVRLARESKVEQFIFVSSRTAGYDAGAYGVSKILAEESVKMNAGCWLIFRLAEVFGGDSKDGISQLLRNAVTKRMVLCPVNVPSKLYPIHVDDAARIMHDEVFNSSRRNTTIHVNGKEGYSYRELVNLVGKAYGKWTWTIPVPRSAMFAIQWVIERFSLDIGIAPDQVPRLYSVKAQDHLPYDLMPIKEYIRQMVQERNRR